MESEEIRPQSHPEDRAYYAHDAEEYVCWDCATPDERTDPAPDGEAVGEPCVRCTTSWEYADAE